jgi:hypothetical protein
MEIGRFVLFDAKIKHPISQKPLKSITDNPKK